MRNKRLAKVISTVAAASVFTCTATASTSAFCINDLFNYIQCWLNGNCNVTTVVQNGNDCTGGNCTQPPTQTEVVKPTTPTAPTTTNEVQAVLDLVNKERKAVGLGTLTLSNELCKVADIRAKEIVKSFSHTRPNGTSCFTAFKENGVTYRYAGENIAYGQKIAAVVMNAWMNSAGHRANILNKNFGKIGISCYTVNGVKYWVQLFSN